MGDSGEGLIDAEARIQERMEELARARAERARPESNNPEASQALQSLTLARADLQRQLDTTTHPRRREGLLQAIADVDQRLAAMRTS